MLLCEVIKKFFYVKRQLHVQYIKQRYRKSQAFICVFGMLIDLYALICLKCSLRQMFLVKLVCWTDKVAVTVVWEEQWPLGLCVSAPVWDLLSAGYSTLSLWEALLSVM